MTRVQHRRRALFAVAATVVVAVTATVGAAHAATPTPLASDGRIYFVDGSTGDIVSTTSTGAGRTVLKGQGNNPAVSPDGTRIAFELSTGSGIGIENVDGTGRVTLVKKAGGMPSWSPDGTKIAFSTNTDIAVVTVATKAVTYLTHDGSTTEEVAPAWSPNGQWIAYTVRGCINTGGSGGRCVYRMDAATGANRLNLTPDADVTSDEPDWTPSNTLVFSSGGCAGGGINIWSMTATGGAKTDLTCQPTIYNSDISPTVAPSGSAVAFTSDERVDPNYYQLYVMNPDGSGITYVDTGSRFGLRSPDWAPAPAAQTTSLTLSAQPTTIASGQSVTLTGKLTPASGQGYAGQSVVVSSAPAGSSTYKKLKTVKTAADGTWKLVVKPTSSMSYHASFAANATLGLGASTSPAQTVTVT